MRAISLEWKEARCSISLAFMLIKIMGSTIFKEPLKRYPPAPSNN